MELFYSQVEILKLTRRDNEQDDLANGQDNLVNDDDADQDNLVDDDDVDQGRGGGGVGSSGISAFVTFSKRQIHTLLLSCSRCQQVRRFLMITMKLHYRDHVISQEDFDDLNDRVRHYMDWSTNNMNYQTLKEVKGQIQ